MSGLEHYKRVPQWDRLEVLRLSCKSVSSRLSVRVLVGALFGCLWLPELPSGLFVLWIRQGRCLRPLPVVGTPSSDLLLHSSKNERTLHDFRPINQTPHRRSDHQVSDTRWNVTCWVSHTDRNQTFGHTVFKSPTARNLLVKKEDSQVTTRVYENLFTGRSDFPLQYHIVLRLFLYSYITHKWNELCTNEIRSVIKFMKNT